MSMYVCMLEDTKGHRVKQRIYKHIYGEIKSSCKLTFTYKFTMSMGIISLHSFIHSFSHLFIRSFNLFIHSIVRWYFTKSFVFFLLCFRCFTFYFIVCFYLNFYEFFIDDTTNNSNKKVNKQLIFLSKLKTGEETNNN